MTVPSKSIRSMALPMLCGDRPMANWRRVIKPWRIVRKRSVWELNLRTSISAALTSISATTDCPRPFPTATGPFGWPLSTTVHWMGGGLIRTRLGLHRDALSDFTRAIQLAPESPGLYLHRGNAYGAIFRGLLI